MNPFLGLNPFDIVKQFTGGGEEVVEEGIEVMPSQFSNLQPPKQKPSIPEVELEDISVYREHLIEKEGKRNEAYKPTEKKDEPWTVGYGHTGPEVVEGMVITDDTAYEYLDKDILKRLPAIRTEFPNFDSYPESVRVPMVGSWFRGGLGAWDDTRNFIKEGKWDKAADAILDNNEYREAKTQKGRNKGMRGLVSRFEEFSDAVRKHGESLKTQGNAQGGRIERDPDNNYNTQRMI